MINRTFHQFIAYPASRRTRLKTSAHYVAHASFRNKLHLPGNFVFLYFPPWINIPTPMADETENKAAEKRPEPGYKKFTGSKLVPLPSPIQQPSDEESFPVFLGVGIALSILALITVFVLAFFSNKTKVNAPPPDVPNAAQNASVAPNPGISPASRSSKSSHY